MRGLLQFVKIKPPGHALEEASSVDQSDPGKLAKAKRAPPMPRFEAREAGFATGFATLGGDATEEGLKRLRRLSSATSGID